MPIEKGSLKNGKKWELILSRKSAVKHGLHLILQITPEEFRITDREISEMLFIATKKARKYAPEKERWRIGVNSSEESTRKHFHIHIILPVKNDKLPRWVDGYENE